MRKLVARPIDQSEWNNNRDIGTRKNSQMKIFASILANKLLLCEWNKHAPFQNTAYNAHAKGKPVTGK